MNFTKKPILPSKQKTRHTSKKPPHTKTTYYKRKRYKKQRKTNTILKFILYTLSFFIICGCILGFVLYKKYIVGLPSIKELENLNIPEASTIYDRKGGELYKIYKEKRTYIPFEDINKNMINAIVAGEDKRYWENPGVDLIGIIRAVIYRTIGKTSKLEGTSTLTQQLIRNTIIANERKIERKIKEIYLSYKLSQGLSKEKVLELYLNKISFGHNSYGIEQAAKTFFAKTAKELGILESSILASLPKGPTHYSPYNHPDRVVGYAYTYPKEDLETQTNITKVITQKDIILNEKTITTFKTFIKNLSGAPLEGTNKILICNLKKEYFKNNINIDNDLCSIVEYQKLLYFLNSIRIQNDDNFIEYQTGRKDFILGRMLEDTYINFEEYKNAIINSIGIKFSKKREQIKAPHFVFYVKEHLEKEYGKEIIESGGLKIYTSLDPEIQAKAQETIEKQAQINQEKFNAKNAAVITIDNETGEILAMVGGRDYFDKENKGNVNIITSRLQPGSTFKPFIYSMGIYNQKIGSHTPIYDVPTEFTTKYAPGNFDATFMGKMNISTALNYSRNIPAIKMFYLAGGESSIISFMQKLGVTSLKNHNMYGAPLALGTGEMTPLELAKAYSVFANMGIKKDIVPILKIVDAKGNTIIEKQNTKGKEVISPGQTYIINTILSDIHSRPVAWNSFLTIPGRILAAKTGTSTKQHNENGEKIISPRNLWTVGYTPQITTVVWAGNNDGAKLYDTGNGLEGTGPIMRDIMNFIHQNKEIKHWEQPTLVEKINISEISGLLPNPENRSAHFLEESLFVNKPEQYDDSFKVVVIDKLCNGKVTQNTPKLAIKKVILAQFQSLSPDNPKWEEPVQAWVNAVRPINLKDESELYYQSKEAYENMANLTTTIQNTPCPRTTEEPNINIKSNIKNGQKLSVGSNSIKISYQSDTYIQSIEIAINDETIKTIPIQKAQKGTYTDPITIPEGYIGEGILKITAIDSGYYSSFEEKEVKITSNDFTPPKILITNPQKPSIKIYSDTHFNLKGEIQDESNIKTIKISISDTIIQTGIPKKVFSYPINEKNKLPIGKHIVKIEVIDTNNNKTTKNIELEIMPSR